MVLDSFERVPASRCTLEELHMSALGVSRRRFLTGTGALAGVELAGASLPFPFFAFSLGSQDRTRADYTLHIKSSPIEIAPKRIVSAITYNGQFPGPLLRFKEGRQVTVDIHNDTDTAEQLHWHGQRVSTDVDGAAEEGTPFIPAHDKRRIAFTPNPAGFRFYHTHNRAGANRRPYHVPQQRLHRPLAESRFFRPNQYSRLTLESIPGFTINSSSRSWTCSLDNWAV
jgi:hypothetical protein